jgi:glycosyltransferase involved in cell wall biosynthesis
LKIGMILDQEFPPDIRVENEAITLVKNGFSIHILCFTYQKDKIKNEVFGGIKIHRLYKSKKWVKRGRALINSKFDFYTPFWAKQIKNFIRKNNIDSLHVHDLYMLGAAFKANQTAGLKIIADLHENYVDGLRYYRFANTFPGNILIPQKKWVKKEKEWCSRADHIITVIEEAVERYIELGVPRGKITVVPNYVNIERFLDTDDNPVIINRLQKKFVAIYIGSFDLHRGLESVVMAVPTIIKEIPNFLLVLVGSGRNLDELKILSRNLKISENITFEGYQPAKNLPSYLKGSSVCLIPHLKTTHTDNTIPHKLFHYMLLEKPVIAANCNPIERILNETQSGMVYTSNSVSELTEKIVYLYKKPELMKEMGHNGRNAVLARYNWDNTSSNLIELYKKLKRNLNTV